MKLDAHDKQFFIAAVVTPIIVWWIFTGRRKYSSKGMK